MPIISKPFKSVYMNLNPLKTENSLLNYDYSITSASNEFVLAYQGRYFKIGEFMYQILRAGQQAKYLEDLHAQLGNVANVSLAGLKEIIDTKILPIFKTTAATASEAPDDGFWYKKQVLSSRQSTTLAKPLSFLFGKSFYFLFLLLTGVNIALYSRTHSIVANDDLPLGTEILTWVASYFSLFFIMFVHELGHTAAAYKSGISARSIGLGFYTIMPAMYTDLTDVWTVSKSNRIKINLAGIYIQLIINLGLVAALHTISNDFAQSFVWKIYIFNSVLMAANLVPLLKLDGYWVLSDFLGVPNLIKTSNQLLLNAVTKKDPFEEEKPRDYSLKKILLVVYTIIRVSFIVFVTFMAFAFVYASILKTIALIRYLPYLSFNFETAIEVLKRVVTIVIISLFTRKYRKLFSNVILKRVKWYRA
ncbi:hypothetical protein DXN04_10990 [Chitinophaga silvisoli]|uniref:Peptidase M50 n=2 Tax=Chitinophaga silvisoli TaxID=2291814 RepID=A0A3E1P3L4_9BACT|nr:hypothetical protein DXN04_10990 [Chitinophaga silvisoli]